MVVKRDRRRPGTCFNYRPGHQLHRGGVDHVRGVGRRGAEPGRGRHGVRQLAAVRRRRDRETAAEHDQLLPRLPRRRRPARRRRRHAARCRRSDLRYAAAFTPDMELGHWVTGSMGHLGHLSRPGHRAIILTRCETRVFPVFEKNAHNAKRRLHLKC